MNDMDVVGDADLAAAVVAAGGTPTELELASRLAAAIDEIARLAAEIEALEKADGKHP